MSDDIKETREKTKRYSINPELYKKMKEKKKNQEKRDQENSSCKNKSAEWLINASMEEILDKSCEQDWNVSVLNTWCFFKIAQNLESLNFYIKNERR